MATQKELLEQQGKTLSDLFQIVLQLAQKQNEQDKINEELRTKIATGPPPIDTHDEADRRVVETSPLVALFHDSDEPKVITFNGTQRFMIYPGINQVPEVFARIYANWLQDENYRVRNSKLLQDKARLSLELQSRSGAQ